PGALLLLDELTLPSVGTLEIRDRRVVLDLFLRGKVPAFACRGIAGGVCPPQRGATTPSLIQLQNWTFLQVLVRDQGESPPPRNGSYCAARFARYATRKRVGRSTSAGGFTAYAGSANVPNLYSSTEQVFVSSLGASSSNGRYGGFESIVPGCP